MLPPPGDPDEEGEGNQELKGNGLSIDSNGVSNVEIGEVEIKQ